MSGQQFDTTIWLPVGQPLKDNHVEDDLTEENLVEDNIPQVASYMVLCCDIR